MHRTNDRIETSIASEAPVAMQLRGAARSSTPDDEFGSLALRVLRWARASGNERGVTLVEILIVVAIIAMVASGVAVFALPKYKEAQKKTAETGARVIRSAIQDWQRVNNESSCPTMSQLVQEKHIDSAANTDDPWGEPYVLTCTDDDVIVMSMGPDKKKGTADDIRVPKNLAGPGGG